MQLKTTTENGEVHDVYAENVDATTNVNNDDGEERQSRQMVTAISTEYAT